jgi:glycosyltransferase involved in cell wall biosynthesis
MNKILVVGLFLSEKNKTKIARTAADQLASLLEDNHYNIIRTSIYPGRIARFIDTLSTIFFKRNEYKIAIVPLYGGFKSYVWEAASTKLLKLLQKKIILVIHGGYIPERMREKPKRYVSAISTANIVVCPSNFIITALNEHGLKSLLIENILQLSDYEFFEKKTFRPKLFWMRTFEDVYNPLMAVQVFALLEKSYPEASMVMAGHDRGMLQQTIDLAKELGVYDKINFPGYITREQKNNFAQDYDFYICTNQIDNAPVTLIEMMAMGLPVITVDSGGIPYMVTDGYNGMMVKYNDVEAMVSKIKHIIHNPDAGIQIITNAKQYAQRYGEVPVLDKWKKTFAMLES